MARFFIEGKTVINGQLPVSGSKNAVLPILACTLLTDKTVALTNCPAISDVDNMLGIMRTLGCTGEYSGNTLYINAKNAGSYTMPEALSKLVRSSIFTLGPILAKFGKARCVYPGGCDIGDRPIDLHLKGLRALNVTVEEQDGFILCDGKNMQGGDIHLEYPSVGATENLMMAATGAVGKTTIYNAAREPEIEDLQVFLRKIGYNVSGAGTPIVVIDGTLATDSNECVYHRIIPDRVVAGTLLCAAAITGGSIRLTDIMPEHVLPVIDKLTEAGCVITIGNNEILLDAPPQLHEIQRIDTSPHPGFPTDMQALMFAVCATAEGTSVITENVFERRFKHIPEFRKMGAVIARHDRTAIIRGVPSLHGATVASCDLRAGAALVLAGLGATGYTTVTDTQLIDRGYEKLDNALNAVGANIVRLED